MPTLLYENVTQKTVASLIQTPAPESVVACVRLHTFQLTPSYNTFANNTCVLYNTRNGVKLGMSLICIVQQKIF